MLSPEAYSDLMKRYEHAREVLGDAEEAYEAALEKHEVAVRNFIQLEKEVMREMRKRRADSTNDTHQEKCNNHVMGTFSAVWCVNKHQTTVVPADATECHLCGNRYLSRERTE